MAQQMILALSNGLHTLATIVLIGFYILMSVVFLPAFQRSLSPIQLRAVFGSIYNQFKFWQFVSLGIVAASGIFLTFIDPFYKGVGQFVNLWSICMLIKHIFILVFVLLVIYVHFLSASLEDAVPGSGSASKTMGQLFRTISGCTISGVAVLLLTAAAQAL